MSRFVSSERVPVTDGDDTIFIKAEITFGDEQRMVSILNKLRADFKGDIKDAKDANVSMAFDIGQFNTAIMQTWVVGWEGPGFDGRPCTPENILELAADDELTQKVLAAINARRNRNGKERADPKSLAAAGKTGSKGGGRSTSR